MIDFTFKMQASFFGDISRVAPTPSTIKRVMDLFSDLELVPGTFMEIGNAGPGQQSRLMMSSPEAGIIINFATNRVDIQKQIVNRSQGLGTIKDFSNLAADAASRISENFNINYNRVSLVADHMLELMTSEELDSAYSKLIRSHLNIGDGRPAEWNMRNSVKDVIIVNDISEEINSIVQINRIQGELEISGEVEIFDRLQLILDINTVAENSNTRFNKENIDSYYEGASQRYEQLMALVKNWLDK